MQKKLKALPIRARWSRCRQWLFGITLSSIVVVAAGGWAPPSATTPVSEKKAPPNEQASSTATSVVAGLDPNDPNFVSQVLDRVDDIHRGDKSHGVMEMEVKTKHWHRTVALESWSVGKDYSMVRILEPKKERGTATLKVKDELFSYLPKTGRTVKISGGMMGGSWMGSHFTNDDLVRSTRMADQYTARISFRGRREAQDVYEFELRAKPDAPVVWERIELVVRQQDLQPVSQSYYNEVGEKLRHLVFTDYRTVNGKTMPITMTMYPLDKPGEFTKVKFKAIDFSPKIDESFFSVQKLKSM